MMTLPLDATSRSEIELLISFVDLTEFAAFGRQATAHEVADLLDGFYERVGKATENAGGHVVKFIGDAALMVFPMDRVDDGVLAIVDLRKEVNEWLSGSGHRCRLVVKAHVGTAIAGPYGAPGAKRFDVVGHAVNTAATVQTRSLAITADTFRKLSPDTRKRFKKHTPPITYIPSEDRRPG
ncbi:adenylate/guanylate cyclase domain-containing protein [Planctomycetota bacterium]